MQISSVQVLPGISNEASGPSYSALNLCRALIANGDAVRLMTVDWGPYQPDDPFVEICSRWACTGGSGYSPELWKALKTSAEHVDIIHNHGLWTMPNIYSGFATKGRKSRLVVSPRGTLSRWALGQGRWKKKIYWALMQKPAIRHAACFHATSESEYQDIRRAGFKQPVCVIPNGIDIPELKNKPVSDRRTLLFLGRIHPVKGIDILLHAWGKVSSMFPQWQLRIVGHDDNWHGPSSGYLSEMKALVEKQQLKKVFFSGPLYGDEKLQAYRSAELFVLPSHSENFGMTVAEALAAGTPAIVSHGAPWEGLDAHHAGWWIENTIDSLVSSLEHAMTLSPTVLSQQGMNGRDWMSNDFSWRYIGSRMHETYRWLLHGGAIPSCVKLN